MIRWPGQVPAGVVTNEMLAATDWLPTLAGMVEASNLVPKDRPIDGVDASAFMLGKSKTTGRDSYMFFGNDGGLMSVKWEIYKVVFRYRSARKAHRQAAVPDVLRPVQRPARKLEPLQHEAIRGCCSPSSASSASTSEV